VDIGHCLDCVPSAMWILVTTLTISHVIFIHLYITNFFHGYFVFSTDQTWTRITTPTIIVIIVHTSNHCRHKPSSTRGIHFLPGVWCCCIPLMLALGNESFLLQIA
jgi:hypothetical protein